MNNNIIVIDCDIDNFFKLMTVALTFFFFKVNVIIIDYDIINVLKKI